ncbi:MAG: hypothetical protein HZA50_02325 [Planctomycetes bacterium]|nr:hypothetical protein [Planctomycetota bacterium]
MLSNRTRNVMASVLLGVVAINGGLFGQSPGQPAATTAAGQSQPSSQPESSAAVPTQPAAQPEPSPTVPVQAASTQAATPDPVVQPVAEVRPLEPATRQSGQAIIRFQFDGVPYSEVVQRFAQLTGKPLIGDLNIDGKLTFFDAQPYTFEEAFDTLNILLEMRGYVLKEEGRFLRMRPLAEATAKSRIIKGADVTVEAIRPGEIVTMMLPLKYVDADTASKAIVRMVSAYGSVAPLTKGKGLVITDKLENIQRVQQMLALLDVPTLVEQQIRTVSLKNASAKVVAGIINNLFGGGTTGRRMIWDPAQGRMVPEAINLKEVVTATSDDRTNTLVLIGTGDKLTMAEEMVNKLDAAGGAGSGGIYVYELKNARAEDLANTIRQSLPQAGQGVSRNTDAASQVRVVADAATNRLVVAAPADMIDKIKELIIQLDEASKSVAEATVIPLKVADAQQLAGVVTNSLSKKDARGRTILAIAISADPRTNSLVLTGNPADIQQARKLIEQLDITPDKESREIHVVQVTVGDAKQLAPALVRLFGEQTAGQRNPRTTSTLKIEAEPQSNCLIISASPADWEIVKGLLTTLKAQVSPQEVQMLAVASTRQIPLQNADPDELAVTLRQVFDPKVHGRATPNAVPVVIAPSKQSKSLLVSATEKDQQIVADLIKTLDVSPAQHSPIILLRLEAADAENLAAKLTAMIPAPPRGQPQEVMIQAEKATNTVLVRAPESQRKMIEELVDKLDKATQAGARETRILPVKNVSAAAVTSILTQMYQGRLRPGRSPAQAQSDDPGRAIIAAAPGDKAVVVDAPKNKFPELEQMIAKLDSDQPQTKLVVRTYQLTGSDAADVARSLQALYAQKKPVAGQQQPTEPEPRFQADRLSNQLIVAATDEQYQEIEKVIKDLQAAASITSQTETFQLKFAKADDIANLLTAMLGDQSASARPGTSPQGKAGEAPVRVAAMTAANSVVVQGPPGKLASARELIKTFDAADAAGQTVVRTIQLKNAQASTMATAINQIIAARQTGGNRPQQQAAAPSVTVTAEPNSNSVLVRGPSVDVEPMLAMIRDLDAQSTASDIEVRVYPLTNALAADLSRSLGKLFSDIVRQQSTRSKDARVVPFSVAADERTNRLVVSTTPGSFALVEKLLTDLDRVPQLPTQDVKYISLGKANASDVASKLNAIYRDRKGADKPVIEADSYSNALTVIAKPEDLTTIEPIISKMDAAANDLQVRVIPLTASRADKMAQMLQRVYGQVTDSRIVITDRLPGSFEPPEEQIMPDLFPPASRPAQQGPASQPLFPASAPASQPAGNVVTIAVDKSANALIVAASRQDLDQIEELVKKLQTSAGGQEAEFRTFKLTQADPGAVAQTLNQLFNPKTAQPQFPGMRIPGMPAQPAQPAPPPVISVVADQRTRCVIIRAKPMDFDIIEPLVKQLDQIPTVVTDIRIFTLKNTDATEVANNLKELFRPQQQQQQQRQPLQPGAQNPQNQRAEMIRQMMEMSQMGGVGGELKVEAPENVLISANKQTNSIVVAAPSEAMKLVERLIQELDQSTAKAVSIQLYPLKSADVRATVTTLQQLFSSSTAPQAIQRFGPMQTTSASGTQPVVVAGDEAARLVIVSAPADKHELIANVIKEIDNAQAGQLEVKVYKVQYADATTVARALSDAMVGQSGQTTGRPGATAGQQSSAVRITADSSSNSIVVRASKENHEQIAKLLTQIDVAITEQYPIQTIMIRNANVTNVADSLNKVFARQQTAGQRTAQGGAQQPVVIQADPDSRMLVIRADQQTFTRIRELAMTLDTAGSAGQANQTVIQLQHAQAGSVAAALTQAFTPARGQKTSPEDQVVVVGEPLSNSLIVTCNEKNLQKIQGLLAKLDTQTAGGTRREFLILGQAKAADIANVLNKIIQGSSTGRPQQGQADQKVSIAADPASNALVMSGPAGEVEKLMKMAMDLDKATESSKAGVYIIPLKSGEAKTTAAMIQNLYNQQSAQARQAGKTIEPLAISSDDRANALVVAASKEMYENVSEWVTKIEALKPVRTPRLIILENADPNEVQKVLDKLYGSQGDSSILSAPPAVTPPRPAQPRQPAAQPRTPNQQSSQTTAMPNQRAIMVDASDEDYQEILKLIKQLDEAAGKNRRQVQIFQLANALNTQVALALNNLYRAVQRADHPEDLVSVTAITQSNMIVVAAAKEKMEEVAVLIQQLDKTTATPLDFRIYPLTNAQPSKIMPILRQMLSQVLKANPNETIDVQADERTRSVIVSARGNMFDQVAKIIEQLDKTPAYQAADVLIIPLKNADATRLAAVLNDMLKPNLAGQVTPEALALQEQIRRLRVSSAVSDKIPELDLTKPIKITADAVQGQLQASNSLIISSTPENLKALQSIVELLDALPVTEGAIVRIIHMENADATSVVTILKDIFTQGKQLAGKLNTTVTGKAVPLTETGKALVNVLNASADARTNTVVISGVPDSVLLAEIICKDLDRSEGRIVTEVRLFTLKHADVLRIVPMLQAVFAETAAAPGAEGLKTQVTRLRTVLEKEPGHISTQPKGRATLTVQADAGTNTIVVAARSDVMPLIADVINTLDVSGPCDLNRIRIYPLANADAGRIKQVIDGLYTGPNAALIRNQDKPTITVDTRTNALVVAAGDKTIEAVEKLLQQLDAKTPLDLRDIRLIPLKNAEAATLATSLQKMMDARVQRQTNLGAKDAEAMKVIIIADARSNSLIIGGSAEGYQIVKDLAEQLDGASPALGGMVQIFPLTNGNAGTISTTLTNLFNQRYQAATAPDVQRQKPVILSDVRTNSLLVAANNDDTRILVGLLQRLDVKLTDPSVRIEVLPLKFNDAGAIGPTIRTLFQSRQRSMTPPGQTPAPQDQVDIGFDALANALIVSASKENIQLIQDLLQKLDVEPAVRSGAVEIITLKIAEAQTVATLLSGLIKDGLYKPGAAAITDNKQLEAMEKVAIAADSRTNVLIVSASKENLAIIKAIIQRLDGDVSPLTGEIQIFPLKYADSAKIAPMIQQFLDKKRQAEVALNANAKIMQAVVIADPRTNTLLVAGGRDNAASIEQMIKQLDIEQAALVNEFKVFFLKQATAGGVQPMLQKLFTERPARGGTKDPVTIIADPKLNALLISATPEDIKLAERLISQLDVVPDKPGTRIQVFQLRKADAKQVAQTLQDLYKAASADATGVGVSVDERLNAVIVSGGEADIKRAEELINRLDDERSTKVNEIRIFTLNNADATELAKVLTDTLTVKPKELNAGSPNRQSLLQFISQTKDGKDLIAKALEEGVLITADKRTNSLVVSAPVENMALLTSLINALDSTTPRMAEIRVFSLTNADATQMADVLKQLFRLQTSGSSTSGSSSTGKAVSYTLVTSQPAADAPQQPKQQNPSGKNDPKNGQPPNPSATVGTAEQDALSVTVDIRTNSLLVGGTRQYVELASKIIQELDSSPAQERMTRVYRLGNNQSDTVQATVRNFLDQERAKLIEALGQDKLGAAQRLLEREVAIVSDKNTNTLLLSASPRYFKTIEAMIQELDQPPPQVLIQVLLAELALDDNTDLGLDWNMKFNDRNKYYTEVGQNFGAQANYNTIGGFRVAFTSSDLTAFLMALKHLNKLEILSRPQLMTVNNVESQINIGQRVPFITDSRITDNNAVINTIQYQDIGTILKITARIGTDDMVNLAVSPEISDIADSTVTINAGTKAIVVNTRKAQTTVSVRDGHTIIIGGLISTKEQAQEDKVPILGDIPLLGLLFRSTKVIKHRAELLIILTPHIVRSPDAAQKQSLRSTQQFVDRRDTSKNRLPNDTIQIIDALSPPIDDRRKWQFIQEQMRSGDGSRTILLRALEELNKPVAPLTTRPAVPESYK